MEPGTLNMQFLNDTVTFWAWSTLLPDRNDSANCINLLDGFRLWNLENICSSRGKASTGK
jgi:hypothetical protein